MKNIKLFTLLICFFLFQAAIFTTNAQCDDITLAAEVIEQPTCYNNGKIKVTIGGDVSKIDLNTLEVSLTADGSGQSVGYSVWPSGGTPQEKIYSQAVKGNYIVKIRFHCQSGLDWYTSSVSATVNVGGSYDPLVTSIVPMRKSMSCVPTGNVIVTFTNGRTPYKGTITGPSGYTGPTTFNTSNATLSLGEVCPGGLYTVTVKDDCDYGGTYNNTLQVLSEDVPTQNLYNSMERYSSTTNCSTIIPYSIYSLSDADEAYYWTRADIYYEYCYLWENTGVKNWQSMPSNTRPIFNLPKKYSEICADGSENSRLYSYVRPKGCTNSTYEKSNTHNLSSYICGTNGIGVTIYEGSNCNSARINANIEYYYALCYPATWKITRNDDQSNVLQSGSLSNHGTIVSYNGSGATYPMSIEYPRGVTYRVTITDSDGYQRYSTFSVPSSAGQDISHNTASTTNTSITPCYVHFSYFISNVTIAPGTKIKYVNGPQQTLPFGLSIGETHTIPANYNSSFFNWTSTDPLTSNYQHVNAGIYNFEITNNCGTVTTRSINMNRYGVQPLTYTTERTCGQGLKVIPSGRLQMTSYQGTTSDYTTYYYIMSGPSGVSFSTTRVQAGTANAFLTLPAPGIYTIGLHHSSTATLCASSTATVVYPDGGLYIDPELTAAYACDDSSPGYIRVEAINGVKPYTYTVSSAPGTATIPLQSNSTGEFDNIGTAGGTYIINVKDACNTEFNIPVTMISMTSASIVYTSNDGKFCNGSEIELNCVSLGNTSYSWTGPNGFTSNVQRPRPIASIINGSIGVSGTYSVTVTPEGCPKNQITQSLVIQVTQPQAPTVTNPNPTAPVNSGNANVVNLSGAAASLSGYTLKWYDSPTGTTTISAPTSVSTTTLGSTTVYYVSQANTSGCESVRQMITFSVNSPYNALRVNPHLRSFFILE